jgi:hypothetical protein
MVTEIAGYTRRYEGTRWQVLYGSYEGVERFALQELQREVQAYLPYVLCIEQPEGRAASEMENLILLGTASDNPYIAELIDKGLLAAPPGRQGYSVACFDSPWKPGQRVIAIAGYDPSGVLYGVEEFNARVLGVKAAADGFEMLRQALDGIPDFATNDRPLIDNRGIWTWGYVIYDYRRFIDNMARLKMNMLTIWNDCAPINSREIIDYAHSRGVSVHLGFHWGWGLEKLDPNSPEHRQWLKSEVVRNYTENYQGLGMDGIYFQTFTEHTNLDLGGKSTATLACEWVNDIALGLFEVEPDLKIQFGLHATSIVDNYTDLIPLDPRVTITWEDAGVIPYAYDQKLEYPEGTPWRAAGLGSPEATIDYSKKLVSFRENRRFAMVPKGWMSLRWDRDFEHHGQFILGERSPEFTRRRLEERQPQWDSVNAHWMRVYPLAARFYREILDCSPETFTVTGLIEDGLFEEAIQPSVALFAATIWNPRRTDAELMDAALSPYYMRRSLP